MKQTRFAPSVLFLGPCVLGALGALGALSACTGMPDVPVADRPPDLATAPVVDASVPPPTVTCQPTVTTRLPLALAELHATTPFAIEVNVGDSGGLKDPHPLKVTLVTADGKPLKTLIDAPQPLGKLPLEFTPAAEKDLPTGALQLIAEVACPEGEQGPPSRVLTTLYVVRVGATQIVVTDGEDGGRVPIMYHALDHRTANYFPIPATLATTSLAVPSGEPELDKPDGTPRRFPDQPWADLVTPPVDDSGAVIETGHTIPVSLKLGTKPDLVFTLGKSAAGATGTQPTGLSADGLPAIRLVVDGIPGSDTARASEGGTATVRLVTSPVPNIDRVDQRIDWHFEFAQTSGTYVRIPDSEQSVILRFYGVLGNTQGTAAPDLPWVAVVDEATKKIAGSATDAATARAILVQHVYEELGLTYDRKSGASHYTSYSGGWNSARFSLGDFLKRSRGNVVNCSDCASILSTYANMIGAKLNYAIIGSNFKLNPIRGIGATAFGSPFDSGRFSFSYHAVTTDDSAMTINDATLELDGDSDPKLSPYTELLVQNVSGSEYLTRLSPTISGTGTPVYQYRDQVTRAR